MGKYVVERALVSWEQVEVEAEDLDGAFELAQAEFADGEGLDLGEFEPNGSFWVSSGEQEWRFTDYELVEEN